MKLGDTWWLPELAITSHSCNNIAFRHQKAITEENCTERWTGHELENISIRYYVQLSDAQIGSFIVSVSTSRHGIPHRLRKGPGDDAVPCRNRVLYGRKEYLPGY